MYFARNQYIFRVVRTVFSLILFFCYAILATGQPTVGLIEYSEEISESYTLFTSLSSESTFLIDNCGNKINEWDGLQPDNSNIAMMGTDGNLVRASFNTFQILSWENEVLWSFDLADLELLRHHDFFILPNGNILFIASQIYSHAEMIDNGRNLSGVGGTFKVDGIYELMPIGVDSASLVWSWNFFDHLVQDLDETKENFDDVANQPRRLDINFNGEEGTSFDWLHCNGIDYNPHLDQIIISSRSTCELYIIDHSTTTEEAASSSGGNYGYGGDFLWRWGNPIAYDMGTIDDQQLWEQHDPKWIKNGYPNSGKITVFNNQFNYEFNGEQPYSLAHILDPESSEGVYPLAASTTFLPSDPDFTFTGEVVGNNMWSNIMSNVQAMPNGNLFISQGTTGEMLEVNQNKEVVWIYQNPVRNFIYEQGSDPLSLSSAVDIFIVTKYPADYQGFINHEMTPLGILENENEVSATCDPSVATEEISANQTTIFPNPASNILTIESNLFDYNYTLIDLFGKELLINKSSQNTTIDLSDYASGIYFFSIISTTNKIETFKVVVE